MAEFNVKNIFAIFWGEEGGVSYTPICNNTIMHSV